MFRKVSVADPDPFGMDPDNAFKFYTDPDPLSFQRGYVLLKQLFLYIFTLFSLSIGPTGPTLKVFFVEFSLPIQFSCAIIVA
jgi:hypothetical protein